MPKKPNTEPETIHDFVTVFEIVTNAHHFDIRMRFIERGMFCWNPDGDTARLRVVVPRSWSRPPVDSTYLADVVSTRALAASELCDVAHREARIAAVKLGLKV